MVSSLEWAIAAMTENRRDELAREAWSWPSSRYRDDPVAFAREVLGVEPWAKQIEILEAVTKSKRVAVCSGHKCGKSHTAAIIALWFYCSFPDARVCMTSVTARQVDAILYREVRKLHAKARRPIDGEPRELARSGIKAEDFREIVGFTAKETEGVAGVSGANVLYIVDEASGVPDEIFEAIEGNRAGGGRIVMFSNPTRTEGEFFEAFESKSQFYTTVHVSSEESPNVVTGEDTIPGLATREYVEEKKLEWGEDSPLFLVRVKGQFVRNESGKIVSLHLIGVAEARWEETEAKGRLFVGLDPAGPGEQADEITFAARRGDKALELEAHRSIDDDAIIVHLVAFCRKHRLPHEQLPAVVVDCTGDGGKLYRKLLDYADEHGEFVVAGVWANVPAQRDQLYLTVSDELLANLATWLREGGAIPEDAKLMKELHAASWEPAAAFGKNAARIKATPKKEIRAALGRSPDRRDALALAVWEPKSLEIVEGAPPAETAMDPYEPELEPGHAPAMSPYTTAQYGARRR